MTTFVGEGKRLFFLIVYDKFFHIKNRFVIRKTPKILEIFL